MTVLITIGMSLLAAIMVISQLEQNNRYIQDFGAVITDQLASSAADPLFTRRYSELNALVESFSTGDHITSIGIINHDKARLAEKGVLPDYDDIHLDKTHYRIGGEWRYHYPIKLHQVVHIKPIVRNGITAGYAIVVFSQDFFDAQMKEQLTVMLIMFIAVLVIAIAASVYLGRRLSSPIRHLISATESIREGKMDIIYDRRNDELGALINAINNMSQGLIRKAQVENMLDRVLSKDVKHKVMEQLDTVQMAGERVEATVLFADMVGFTRISEKISPEEVQDLLNEYYGYFNACARFYFGTVDKYIGDCVMVVFGATRADPQHQYHAIACASLMQKLAEQLNQRRHEQGIYPIELRIGINSGRMVAGLIGSSDRMEYTVVGDAVNLASRLCSEATGSQIIIEESLYHAVNPEHPLAVEAHKQIRVRGKEEPVTIYSVVNIEQNYRVVSSDLIEDIMSAKYRH
ncbi:MAG TPA: adenylate/guanylate cyclase domain-containing protein [Pseudomonadales bacterium]